MTDLQYPIGRFARPAEPLDAGAISVLIAEIERLPGQIREAVRDLDEAALTTPYRPGGWTVRQVVHHVPDSHMNAYIRWKLAVTEDSPTIKPYAEDRWAELPDGRDLPIEVSLRLLEALHQRWVAFMRHLPYESFSRVFVHPEMGTMRLDVALALYAWHGRHHLAHIRHASA